MVVLSWLLLLVFMVVFLVFMVVVSCFHGCSFLFSWLCFFVFMALVSYFHGFSFWNISSISFFVLNIILIKAMAKFWCMCQVPLVASGASAYGFLDQPLKVPQVILYLLLLFSFCMFQRHLYLWRAVLSAAGIVTDDRPVRFMSSYNNKKT